MISYSLALKLKEHGFPLVECSKKECVRYSRIYNFEGCDFHCPDLSELIEACRDGFDCLERSGGYENEKAKKPLEWFCGSYEYGAKCPDCGLDDVGLEFVEKSRGSTPEEAVSLLFIKLHDGKH